MNDAMASTTGKIFEFMPHKYFINFDLIKQDNSYYLVLQIYDAEGKIPQVVSNDAKFDTSDIEPSNEIFLKKLSFINGLNDGEKEDAFNQLRKDLRGIKDAYNDTLLKMVSFINNEINFRKASKEFDDEKKIYEYVFNEFFLKLSKTLNLYSPMYEDPEVASESGVTNIYEKFNQENLPEAKAFEQFYKIDNGVTYFNLYKTVPFITAKHYVRNLNNPDHVIQKITNPEFNYALYMDTYHGKVHTQNGKDSSPQPTKFPPDPGDDNR